MTEQRAVPDKQWRNWAERILAGEHLEEEMQNADVLPHADTPLPPTNAIIHILYDELGYGTPDRSFVMICGVRWAAKDRSGEHKYFFQGDHIWFKHVNCERCRELFGLEAKR